LTAPGKTILTKLSMLPVSLRGASDAGLLLPRLVRRSIQLVKESAVFEHVSDMPDQRCHVVFIAQNGGPTRACDSLGEIPRQGASGRFELLFRFLQRFLIAVRHLYPHACLPAQSRNSDILS
jgi:hypothetical protein